MDRRHALSVMGLFLATALALGLARLNGGWFFGTAEDRLPKPQAGPVQDSDEARKLSLIHI